jgi:hypothetical protein
MLSKSQQFDAVAPGIFGEETPLAGQLVIPNDLRSGGGQAICQRLQMIPGDTKSGMRLQRRQERLRDSDVKLLPAKTEPHTPAGAQGSRLLELGQAEQLAEKPACLRLAPTRSRQQNMVKPENAHDPKFDSSRWRPLDSDGNREAGPHVADTRDRSVVNESVSASFRDAGVEPIGQRTLRPARGVATGPRPPDVVVAPPWLLPRPAASLSTTVTHTSRITRTQQSDPGVQTPLDLRCVRTSVTPGLHDDHTPSLQLYDDGGWYCFACRVGGSIYDFGALLFELDTRGHQFLRLRQRLVHELHIVPSARLTLATREVRPAPDVMGPALPDTRLQNRKLA